MRFSALECRFESGQEYQKGNKMKILMIVLSVCLLIGCSTAEQRKQKAELLGEIVYQAEPKARSADDIFIIKQFDRHYLIVKISSMNRIWDIHKFDIKCRNN